MINLFRRAAGEGDGLAVALVALLEHADRGLLTGFLHLSGVSPPIRPDDLRFGPEGVTGHNFHLRLVTQAPDEPPLPDQDSPETVAITLTGAAPPGATGLSWEQVDRWLTAAADRYDPETRTGFLVRQFQEYLREAGIAYFAGFDSNLVEQAGPALATLTQFFGAADGFMDGLGSAFRATWPGLAEVRRSRAEDLLTLFVYRDFAGPPLAGGGFLRLALQAAQQEWHLAFWTAPGEAAHSRLRGAVMGGGAGLETLQGLEGEPRLWLWSPENELVLSLDDLPADGPPELDWGRYQVALQQRFSLLSLTEPGAVPRVLGAAQRLLEAVLPLVAEPIH